jgi:hypothetical protein
MKTILIRMDYLKEGKSKLKARLKSPNFVSKIPLLGLGLVENMKVSEMGQNGRVFIEEGVMHAKQGGEWVKTAFQTVIECFVYY